MQNNWTPFLIISDDIYDILDSSLTNYNRKNLKFQLILLKYIL